MTKDDIIRMAKEAGFERTKMHKALERFAYIVAASEREACAKTVENHRVGWTDEDMELNDIAAEIRARGQK